MKKLTDEEIVKTLECCDKEECKDCIQCGEFVSQFNCMRCAISKALALIHRLQTEKEELKYAREMASKESKEFVEYATKINAEQKAEIERLKNAYKEGLAQGKFDSQVKIAELQKQVDELKEDIAEKDSVIDNLIKERPSIEKYAVKDTAKEILTEIDDLTLCIIDGSNEFEKGYFQAITDLKTAIKDLIKEHYGVEVE